MASKELWMNGSNLRSSHPVSEPLENVDQGSIFRGRKTDQDGFILQQQEKKGKWIRKPIKMQIRLNPDSQEG